MVRHRLALALLIVLAVGLSGCNQLVDVDHRALVLGVGLDANPAGTGYLVAVEYPVLPPVGGAGTGGTGQGQTGGGGMSFRTIEKSGANIGDAMLRFRMETDRVIYLGNLSVIAVGAQLAARGVLTPLDYFIRAGEVSESAQVVIAEPDAVALLNRPSPNGVALPLFEYLRRSELVSAATAPDPLWRFLALSYSLADAAYAPLVQPSPQGQPFRVLGTALIVRGRMVGQLIGYQSAILDWLVKRGGYPEALISLPGATGTSTLRVTAVRKRLQVISPSAAVLHMHFETFVSEGAGLHLDDHAVLPFEQAATSQITTQIRGVLATLQADGTDVIGLAPYMHARYPDVTADWPKTFSHLHLGLDVTVSITGGARAE